MMSDHDYTAHDIKCALRDLGVHPSANVVIFSSLMHLGYMREVTPSKYPAMIVEAIRDYLGEGATLAAPAGNWDYGKKCLPFDAKKSAVTKALGVLPAYIAHLPEANRSLNPIFSIAAVGPKSEFICDGGVATAFGIDSAWDRLYALNADMIFMGCGIESMTFIRYIEHRFSVPYLYTKLFRVPVYKDGVVINSPVTALLRYKHCPVEYDLKRFESVLEAAGALRKVTLGAGCVSMIRMNDCFRCGIEALKQDLHFFLKSPPQYSSEQIPLI